MRVTGPALDAAVDMRIHDLWGELLGFDCDHEIVGVFMRAAYAQGYIDSIKEEGRLLDELGYPLPKEET